MAKSRTPRSKAIELLRQSTRPLYLLDSKWRVVVANQPLAEWVGLPMEQIENAVLRYGTSTQQEAGTLLGLAPPPDVGSSRQSGIVSVVARDGRLLHRDAEFVPLSIDDGSLPTLLVVVDGRDKSAVELAAAEQQLSAAEVLHRQLLEWHRQESGRWTIDLLAGTSPLIVRAREQVHAAAASGAATLVTGACGSDVASVARAIHGQSQGVGGRPAPARTLLAIDLRLADAGELAARIAAARNQETPTTLLLEFLESIEEDQQRGLAEALSSLPSCVQPIGTVSPQQTLCTQLSTRLSVIAIDMPTLNDRPSDLPLLSQSIVEQFNAGDGRQIAGLDPSAVDLLALYAWPNGYAELTQVIGEAHARCSRSTIGVDDLPPVIHHAASRWVDARPVATPINIDEVVANVEQWLIERALELGNGNKAEAARLLGVSRPRLYRRLESLGLLPDGRDAAGEDPS